MDADKFTKIYSCNVFETCGTLRFLRDGKRVYMETNKGADVDLTSLVLLDPETGKTEMVESDHLNKVDLSREPRSLKPPTRWSKPPTTTSAKPGTISRTRN